MTGMDSIISLLLSLSPVVRILAVFLLILLFNRLGLPLGVALLAGGLGIDLWAGRTVALVGADLLHALAAPELWLLLLNITLILEFGYFMSSERNSRIILAAARRLGGRNGRALGLVLIPATIGLVPMPGGALFSAPLVGETLRDRELPAAWKASVNYWFRHVLEYWWPLYPVVIVTLSIFNLSTWHFFLLQVPFTAVSIGAGWFFLLRRRLSILRDAAAVPAPAGRELLEVLAPILLIVLSTLLLPGAVARLVPGASPTTDKLLAMLAGLAVALLLIARRGGSQGGHRLFSRLVTAKTAGVIFTLAGVMLFQGMLEASALLPAAGRQLGASHIPVEIIIAFLPFLAGLVTGLAIGFGGPAFPLVVGLAAADPGLGEGAALVLAFSMGYAGMMLSPVHLCYVLTRKYFFASLADTYRYLVPCVLVIMAWGIGFHVFLRLTGW